MGYKRKLAEKVKVKNNSDYNIFKKNAIHDLGKEQKKTMILQKKNFNKLRECLQK